MDPDIITLVMLCFAGVILAMFAAAMVIHADLKVLAAATIQRSRRRRPTRASMPQDRRRGLRASKRVKYGLVGLKTRLTSTR